MKHLLPAVAVVLLLAGCTERSLFSPASSRSATKSTAHTITYAVSASGDSADVTYENTSGGSTQLTVGNGTPWQQSVLLHSGDFASVYAQLNGRGQVTCEIKLDGQRTGIRKTSEGEYQIAHCTGRVP